MTDTNKTIDVKQENDLATEKTERIRDRRVYLPRTDIFETKDGLVLVMDVPGVDEKSVDITLEKNVLTINAYPAYTRYENHNLAYAEYGEGDYQRSFALSDEIDRSKIEARVKNGVLYLQLAKAGEVAPHKINVIAG
jgi:HSP20 family molecular chaperone IbpA